jgi:hypothetical protein
MAAGGVGLLLLLASLWAFRTGEKAGSGFDADETLQLVWNVVAGASIVVGIGLLVVWWVLDDDR